MGCNCKRVKNFDELRQELEKNVKVIRVSRLMKCMIFMKVLIILKKYDISKNHYVGPSVYN